MRKKKSFFESGVCKGGLRCQECRVSREYREGIAQVFDVPEVDFKCPYGKIAEEYEQIEEPSLFGKAKNLTKTIKQAAADKIKGGHFRSDEDLVKKRLGICQMCNYYQNNKCKKCGCRMKAKVEIKASKCPINKW